MIITGVQPTGNLHIGNYLGAIRPLIDMQNPGERTVAFIADYHAITAGFDPATLYKQGTALAAMILACGFDNDSGILFRQSDIPEHVELAHILACTAARVGQLNRMVQFRDKMENLAANQETPSVGLYSYPVLQAADVLLYSSLDKSILVPVGEDQMQHLNLAVDVAASFNHRFGKTFPIPRPVVSPTPRIMSLFDGSKKMSKSDPNDMHRINMSDAPDLIAKKLKRATSDSHMVPDNVDEIGERKELRNLLTIYSAFAGTSLTGAVQHFAGKGFGVLKSELTEAVVAVLAPIQERYAAFSDIAEMYLERGQSLRPHARNTLSSVKKRVGLTR